MPLLNPMSRQESHLRRDRLAGLLTHLERNLARGVRDVHLFELGTAFAPGDPRPVETARVAIALTGSSAPEHWSGPSRPWDVYDIAHLLRLVGGVAHPGSETRPGKAAHGPFSPAVTYELVGAGGDVVGWAGRVKLDALDLPPWAGDVLGLEVVLPQEPPAKAGFAADPPPSHPASGRDLAFLVPATVAAGAVADAIRDGGGELLESVTIFDLYEGDDLPSGSRSVAYGLRFRARDRTLKDEEVDEAVQRILRRVREMTGVEPRV